MDKFLHNFVVISCFLAFFLLLPKHVAVKPWIDKEHPGVRWNVMQSLSVQKSRVKRQSCWDTVKCDFNSVMCIAASYYLAEPGFVTSTKTARESCQIDLCDAEKNCSDGKDEEITNNNTIEYFTLHPFQEAQTYSVHSLHGRTLNQCLEFCLEFYGCRGVQSWREEETCWFYFNDYNELHLSTYADFYTLKNPEGPVACASDEHRCSPGRCVPIRWLCDGEEDCINGRDEEGCSLIIGIFTKTTGQIFVPAIKIEQGLSLQGCAKLCTEEEKECSRFSYEENGKKCSLECTDCGNLTSSTPSNSTDLYTLDVSQGVEYTQELLRYLSSIGKILPLAGCPTTPPYGLPRTPTSIPDFWECRYEPCERKNNSCPAEWNLYKCSVNSLCHFVGQRGRILKDYTVDIHGYPVFSVVECARLCLEIDGCRGFAYNYVSWRCFPYYDMDFPSQESAHFVLYSLRIRDNDVHKKGEYKCGPVDGIPPQLLCDGKDDCLPEIELSKDEQRCDAVEKYEKALNYQVVTSEEEDQERRIWEMVTVEACAKLCQDEAHHCTFFNYFQSTQLCVLGCPPESQCGRTNKLVSSENSTLYYRLGDVGYYPHFWDLVESSSYADCQRVQYYSTYQSMPYSAINISAIQKASYDTREDSCEDKVLECVPSLCNYKHFLCDGKVECPSGKDEHKCDTSLCFFSLIIGTKFIMLESKVWILINVKGCAKGCLEIDGCLAFAYNEKDLICRFYFSLPSEQVEDSNYNLYLLKNADKDLCPENTFICSHAQCIPQEAVCDGKEDCNNGKDEESCGTTYQTTNSPPLQSIQMPRSQTPDTPVSAADCGQREVNFDPSVNQSYIILRETGYADRIVGGTEVPYGAYPWQVQIMVSNRTGWQHLCGGTILSAYHVLTAAHCMMVAAQPQYQIIVGQHDIQSMEEEEQGFAVQNIYIHNHYNRVTRENDIALVRIRPAWGRVIKFGKHVQPACLPQPDTPYVPGTLCHVSGWGKVDADAADIPESTSPVLRAAVVPLVSDGYCRSLEVFRGQGLPIGDNMFCAGYIRGGADSCQGDSGGPLACKIQGRYTVMGIVSFGVKCGRIIHPGVYVRVSSYIGWIHQHMQLKK